MNAQEQWLQALQDGRSKMEAILLRVDTGRKIYPLWTIKEIIAHLSGWDEAVIATIRAVLTNEPPATPAALGANHYNEQTVATREALPYDRIVAEWRVMRKELTDLIMQLTPEQMSQPFIMPWGSEGTFQEAIDGFGYHELEHAEEITKILDEVDQLSGKGATAPTDTPPTATL